MTNPSITTLLLLMTSSCTTTTATTLLRGQEKKTTHQQRMLPKGGWNQGCKINGEKIGIYIGGGTGPSSKLWAEALATFFQTGNRAPDDSTKLNDGGSVMYAGDSSVTYVTLTESEIDNCYNGELDALDLLIMPGGSAYGIQDALGGEGKAAITSYLDNGGNYIGFCAGGYYIARGYYWKGDDGDPIDNCKNKFCKYEVSGTYSYDPATKDFTTHEWGGTSYHSNLLAYGPMAGVLVEGPVEEIAGPWNPAQYDSVVVKPKDVEVPDLRQVYYGGATEKYIHTNPEANGNANWGEELSFFVRDSGDLLYPNDSLWSFKTTATQSGGKIWLTSSHAEASLYHTTIGDGGMTECQQYNNYVFLTRAVSESLGINTLPDYDMDCSSNRKVGGEVKDTATLYPGGLAYATAPRIGGEVTTTTTTTTTSSTTSNGSSTTTTSGTVTTVGSTTTTTTIGNPGSGGACGENHAVKGFLGFEEGTIVPGTISGDAVRPWAINSMGACNGSNNGLTAGVDASGAKGVDTLSTYTVDVPQGATKMSYFYSYPAALDRGDDFHVVKNNDVVYSYENGPGASCASACIDVIPGDVVRFVCKSGGNNELCSIDEIRFQGSV